MRVRSVTSFWTPSTLGQSPTRMWLLMRARLGELATDTMHRPQHAACADCDFFLQAFNAGAYARSEPGLNLVADAAGAW